MRVALIDYESGNLHSAAKAVALAGRRRGAALHQHVVVVGVVRDGAPVATAIADGGAAAGEGRPMDYQLPN